MRIASPSPSPPPPTRSKASPPPLRRRGSSIETQIYVPARSPSLIARHELQGSNIEVRDFCVQHQTPSQPSTAYTEDYSALPQTPSRPSTAHDDAERTTAEDIFDLYASPSPTSQSNWSNGSAVKALRRVSRPSSSNGHRLGNRAGMSQSPEQSAPPSGQYTESKPTSYANPWLEGQVYPRRPPSPPATPESDQSFSIDLNRERPSQEKQPPPPPVPDRSPRRTPPRASSTQRPAELPSLEIQPKLAGAREPPAVHSPAFSMTTRRSSFGASAPSSNSQYHLQHQANPKKAGSAFHSPTFSMTTRKSSSDVSSSSPSDHPRIEHQRRRPSTSSYSTNLSINARTSSLNATSSPPHFSRINSMPEKLFMDDDDADLESLPSTMDSNVTPWAELDAGPIHFRDKSPATSPPVTRPLSIMSTRASSFDSAAPPPIRLRGSLVPTTNQKPLPDTPKKRFSSLLFSRLTPKAVLYTQTAPGKHPVPISVSRTSAPSIPTLFPRFEGQFPPPPPPPLQSGKEATYNGRRTRDSSTSTQKRGRSVPPKSSGDRRKSWFKGPQIDRVLGRGQPVIEKNIQEIIRANQAAISG